LSQFDSLNERIFLRNNEGIFYVIFASTRVLEQYGKSLRYLSANIFHIIAGLFDHRQKISQSVINIGISLRYIEINCVIVVNGRLSPI
jgi:hypothetical protein